MSTRSLFRNERFWRRVVIALGVAVLIVCAARAIIKPGDGDFKLHWETGRRFLAKEFLYTGGHNLPYPPFFGMILAPATLLPMPVAKALLVPFGIAALLVLLSMLQRLVGPAFRLNERQTFWATALATLLAIQFIIRDQAEVGLNTALIALTWLSIYLWRQQRDFLAGAGLGLTIATKWTPAFLLAYFVWKRQWRVTAVTLVATVCFTVAPMLWQGPVSWSNHMRTWLGNVIDGVSGSGFENAENFRDRNMALRPVLMRYLTHLPQGDFGSASSALPAVNVVDLPRTVASWIANLANLGLTIIFLWWSRRAVAARDDPRLLWEFAAAAIVGLLVSPITWSQHCVALLPACYLVTALLIRRDQPPRWIIIVLSFYMFFCSLLGRDLIGGDLWPWLISYHISTFCILGLFIILLAGPRESLGLTTKNHRQR